MLTCFPKDRFRGPWPRRLEGPMTPCAVVWCQLVAILLYESEFQADKKAESCARQVADLDRSRGASFLDNAVKGWDHEDPWDWSSLINSSRHLEPWKLYSRIPFFASRRCQMSGVHVSQHNIHMTARTRLRKKKTRCHFSSLRKTSKCSLAHPEVNLDNETPVLSDWLDYVWRGSTDESQ